MFGDLADLADAELVALRVEHDHPLGFVFLKRPTAVDDRGKAL